MIKKFGWMGFLVLEALLIQGASAQDILFLDNFEKQEGPVWSSGLDGLAQLSVTKATPSNVFPRSGASVAHISVTNSSGGSTQTFSPVSYGNVRLSWWVNSAQLGIGLNNGYTTLKSTSFRITDASGAFFLGFLITDKGGIVVETNDLRGFETTLEKKFLTNMKWQEMSIDYDFSAGTASFSLDGEILYEGSVILSDLAVINFSSGNPEFYMDDVELKYTHIQTSTDLSNILGEGFEEGHTVAWAPANGQSSGLEPTTIASHSGSYSVARNRRGLASALGYYSDSLVRELSPIVDGTVTASAWVLNDNFPDRLLATLVLGDSLQISLRQQSCFSDLFEVGYSYGEEDYDVCRTDDLPDGIANGDKFLTVEGSSREATQPIGVYAGYDSTGGVSVSVNFNFKNNGSGDGQSENKSNHGQVSGPPAIGLSADDNDNGWVQLTISYNFATETATFSANGRVFHTLNVPIRTIDKLTIMAENSDVYIDDVQLMFTPPARFVQVSTDVDSITESITLSSIAVAGGSTISWNPVPGSEGYRLYFAPQAFSNVSDAQSADLGQDTTLSGQLPFGRDFYVVIAAYVNGKDVAFSNMHLLSVPLPELRLAATVDKDGNLRASWDAVAGADFYRLYYSDTAFSEITTQSFVSFAYGQLGLKTSLPVGTNYYIAVAAVKAGSIASKLSNLEDVSYGNISPVFPEPFENPDWIDEFTMKAKFGGTKPYTEEEALNFFRSTGAKPSDIIVVERPYIAKIPPLETLYTEIIGYGQSSAQIEASLVTLKLGDATARAGGEDYVSYYNDTRFRHSDFWKVDYYGSDIRAKQTTTLGLAFHVTFNAEDLGNEVKFFILLVNDKGDLYSRQRNDSGWKRSVGPIVPYARGIATAAGTEPLVLDITDFDNFDDQGMAGKFNIVLGYESVGVDGEVKKVISVPISFTIDAEFQKLDSSGRLLNDNATLWHCFRDVSTGLTWEAKTSIGLHDGRNTYSWYSSDPEVISQFPAYEEDAGNGEMRWRGNYPNGGECADSGNCDTESFVNQVNEEGLCGMNDWRLPTVTELRDKLNLKTTVHAPFFAHRYFGKNPSGPTWTSTRGSEDWSWYQRIGNWHSNFARNALDGSPIQRTLMSSPLKIMLVR
jgi:hypothetical protein